MLNQAESMDILQAVVLGVVQGLSEFLPISSTAHIRAVPALLGWADPGVDFTAVIQLGSVLALFAYFRNDIVTLASGSFSALRKGDLESKEARIAGAIIVGTIPVCVIGLLFKGILEQDGGPLRSLYVIGTASIVMGLLLLAAEKLAKHTRTLDSIGVKDGLIIGLGQAMALIPGCSRTWIFIIYRIIFGAALIGLTATNLIH
jgi:undecaprenyl-diphosphatase